MDWTTLLFSFKGRINRGKYWLAILIYIVAWIAFVAAAVMWLGGFDTDRLFSMVGGALLLWLAAIVLITAGTWSGIATGIKRLHDREKSGWWILGVLARPQRPRAASAAPAARAPASSFISPASP